MQVLCPICKEPLKKEAKTYICEKKHNFDIAKEGYTNLLLKNSQQSGDNKEMVVARTNFLSKEFYKPLVDAIFAICEQYQVKHLVDCGCGEGYYTNQLASQFDVIGFDLSKQALKYASKQGDKAKYFLASIFEMPLGAASVDAVMSVFTPCPVKEIQRVMRDESIFIKVDPNSDHLFELKSVLYETLIENGMQSFDEFELIDKKEITFLMDLKQEDIKHLFMMTPYYFKSSKEGSEQLLSLAEMTCRASFIIYIYKKHK